MEINFKRVVIATITTAAIFAIAFLVLSLVTINKYQGVDLPEELRAIAADSTHAELLYGWRDSGGMLHIDMRNNK